MLKKIGDVVYTMSPWLAVLSLIGFMVIAVLTIMKNIVYDVIINIVHSIAHSANIIENLLKTFSN